jgi:heme exporter protein A
VSRFSGTALACQRSERLVFTNLDFAVESGGALVLTGPNGSGKSSLLRLMAGLIRPFSGRLDWDGTAVAHDQAAHRGRIAYLGHLDAIKPVLTAGEAVRFWAGLSGREDDANAALADLGLLSLADLPGRFLSAGQRRRVALARVVATGAILWLLDEPTVGLDLKAVVLLESALAAHRAAGGMVIAATHAPILLPGAAELDLTAFAPVAEFA